MSKTECGAEGALRAIAAEIMPVGARRARPIGDLSGRAAQSRLPRGRRPGVRSRQD